MKIVILGATGTIGREIDALLSEKHEIVRVGYSSGDVRCDYTDPDSVDAMYRSIGAYDALICTVGRDSAFKAYEELVADDYRYGFERKFLGQVNLVKQGMATINDGGCFLLTTGFLCDYPNPASIATGPFNAAVDTFATNTAPLLERGVRLNVVSPAPIVPPGSEGRGRITAEQCARYYVEAIEGDFTGRVLRAWGGLPRVLDPGE